MDQGSPTPSPDNNLIANRKIKNPVRRLNKEPSSVRSTPSFGSMEPPQMNNPSQPAPSFAFGFGGSAFGTPPASNPFQQTSNTPPPSTLFSPTNTFTPPTGKPDGPSPVVFNFGNSPFTPTGSQQDKPISAGLQSPTMFPTVTQQTPQVTMTAEKTGDNGHIDLSSAESRKRKDTSQSFQRTDSRMRHGPSPLSQSSFVPTQGSTVPGAKDTEERLRSTPSSTQPATTNTPTTPITTTTATDTNTSTLFGSEAIKAPKISFDSFGSTSNTLPKTTELPSTPSPTVQPDAPKVSFWTPKNDTPPKTDNIDGKDQETPVPSLKDVFKPGPVNLWNVTKDTKLPGVPVFGKTPSRESGSSSKDSSSPPKTKTPTTVESLVKQKEDIKPSTRFSELPPEAMEELVDLQQLIFKSIQLNEKVDAHILLSNGKTFEHTQQQTTKLTEKTQILKYQIAGKAKELDELSKDISYQRAHVNVVKIFCDDPSRRGDEFTNGPHWDYFTRLASNLQERAQEYGQTIKKIEAVIDDLNREGPDAPMDIGKTMEMQHNILMGLTARVSDLHDELGRLKTEAKKIIDGKENN